MVIAIDGPAGSGKSTIARELAKKLGYVHLDTGGIYRLITLFFLNNKIEISLLSESEILNILKTIKLKLENKAFYLDGENVTKAIRTKEIDENVSKVAANKIVREYSVSLQQKLGNDGDFIVDGRDIGTVVFPHAKFKFYLIATPEIRAKRRLSQNLENGNANIEYEEILNDIKMRDEKDMNREESPLKHASDAIIIDTSCMSFDDVLNKILKVINVK